MLAVAALALASVLLLDDPPPAGASAPASAPDAADAPVVREGTVEIAGRTLCYTSHAGTLPLKPDEAKEKARIFFVAYVAKDAGPVAQRPVTFVFNGGPGSSSVWLHLGAFGPVRVAMPDAAVAPAPPGRLVPNPNCILDLTDLVFIDPVTTGYSRPAEGENGKQFHGVNEDVRAVGEFIRLWTTRYQRWSSPKFLAGESYGTTRAAALARHLEDRHGIYLNGIVLISAILNFQTAEFDPGNDLAFPLILPSYAAVAAYHGALGPTAAGDRDALLARAERFALGDFSLALLQGDRLDPARRRDVIAELHALTGLSESFLDRSDLRVRLDRFAKELLRERGSTVGRLDARFLGKDADAAGSGYEYDASYAAIQGAYTDCLNDYVRGTLGYVSDLPYEILTGRVQPWNYGGAQNQYLNVADDLREAIAHEPALRVFVAQGIYDLATPYFAVDYTFAHLRLDAEQRARVELHRYPSGHMVYIHGPSHAQLRNDLAGFYREALARAAR